MAIAHQKAARRHIFIVDDHPVVRDGFRSIINEEPDLLVCGETGEAADALTRISATRPDLIVLDLSLGRGSGLEVLKDLAVQHPAIPVIVVSMHDEAIYAERALKARARGYLMKSESSECLLAAIRRVLNGKVFVSNRVMTIIASKLGQRTMDTRPIQTLSDRELRTFELIGRGLSSRDIAQGMHISIKTVQSHFKSLKAKLGFSSHRELLREAFRWQDSPKR